MEADAQTTLGVNHDGQEGSNRSDEPTRMDSGMAALSVVAGLHHVAVDTAALTHEYAAAGSPSDCTDILRAAHSLGFKAEVATLDITQIRQEILPVIALGSDGEFFVLARIARSPVRDPSDTDTSAQRSDAFLIQRHDEQTPKTLSIEDMRSLYAGDCILLKLRNAAGGSNHRQFNLRWFLPSIVKYRRLFTEVLVASFLLQLFALVTPLFIQVVMDKVLAHQGFTTLNVLAIGFCVVVFFDALIGGLRNYLFSHTSSRVDVELGAKLFDQLSRLPLAYFQARQVGQTVARVRELDTLRQFITGTALTLLIDVSFTFVFFGVLWYYSPQLTLVVFASLPFYIFLSFCITPALRNRLDEKFRCGAINQSFLTEFVTGAETVKAQAVEPQCRRRWEDMLAHYVRANFAAQNLGNIAGQIAGLVSKLTTLGIIWWGAHLVIGGALTAGQLIAFNMIAGRVSAPILKLLQLWQDFQQAGISMARLGDILNTPVEQGAGVKRSTPSRLLGQLRIERLRFRYTSTAPLVLDELNLTVEAGQIVGIVGSSGSGKSTIALLLQRMYVPEAGRILLDGTDIGTLDTAWLRRSIGVVQQDSFLFNRSVRDNIALAHPACNFDRVIQCAKVAGAHDFIVELPQGYDTIIEEQGSNLSGGQRQRIAIARSLILNPRILIMDEATAALDYESERVIQENMGAITQNRTVLIIAHRLSTLRHCDNIVVLEGGRVTESGTHDHLVDLGGYYARLYSYQNHSPRIRQLHNDLYEPDRSLPNAKGSTA